MSVIYVKKVGAPSGTINITAAGQSLVIDDSSHPSISTNSAAVAVALDQNPYVQRKGSSAQTYVPPATDSGTLLHVSSATPTLGDVLTYTSQGYAFTHPTSGTATGNSIIITEPGSADPDARDYDDGTLWIEIIS